MDPDISKIAQVLALFGGFCGFVAVLVIAVRGASWAMRSPRRQAAQDTPRFDDTRFTRLEEAVDSIALEVERIAEAQRFTAKLMSERLPNRLPDGTARVLPEQQS
jgi:hypothetical protein